MNALLRSKIFLIGASGILVIFLLIGLLWGSLSFADYQNRGLIVDGVVLGSMPVGGLTREQAYDAVSAAVDAYEQKGILFEAGEQSVLMKPDVISQAGPDYSHVLFDFDVRASVDAAYGVTRDGGLIKRALERFYIARDSYAVPMRVTVHEQGVKDYLSARFSEQETVLKETQFRIDFLGEEIMEIDVEAGSSGRVLRYDRAVKDAYDHMRYVRSGSISMVFESVEPLVSDVHARALVPEVRMLLSSSNLIFSFKEKQWRVPRSVFAQWIGIGVRDGKAALIVREDMVNAYLDELATDIEVSAQSAKFEIGDDGRVRVFEASVDGLVIDREKMLLQIEEGLLKNRIFELSVAVKISPADISTADVNDFGIQELIAEGRTNFSGSPVNRRHNIANGISLINGQLIKPEEEFSTIAALGHIDEAHGFRPELVIKGNETKPEVGGGLCQVSTTLFRATLNAGLPVTARRSHSYRVRYYEPPVGKDATIYDPAPDYKFLNDTGHYILIKGWVDGDEAVFQLWGVKDARTVVQTDPVVYNFVPPPESKRVLTSDLKPGVVKCTERAHTGASAHFDYVVTYPDGTIKEERFSSVYRPWGEVCLVGATADELAEDAALKQLQAEQAGLVE